MPGLQALGLELKEGNTMIVIFAAVATAIAIGLAIATLQDKLNPKSELTHISNTSWDD